MTVLVLLFKKIESEAKTKFDNFYSGSKAEIIISESDIDDVFIDNVFYNYIKPTKTLGKDLGQIIDSVTYLTISNSKYNPFAEISYIKLPKELDHPRK